MVGFIKEVEKGYLYRLDFKRPFRRVASVKVGKQSTKITLDNGDTISYPNETGVQYKSKVEQAGMIAKED